MERSVELIVALWAVVKAGGAYVPMAPETPAARLQSSPAPLRLACSPLPHGRLDISVFKRRGPPQAAPLRLSLPPIAGLEHPAVKAPDHAVARAASAVAAA